MEFEQQVNAPQGEWAESECQHHWIIDTPNGPTSNGVCRLCGAKRDFQNCMDGRPWEDDIRLEEVSSGSRYPGGGLPQSPDDD